MSNQDSRIAIVDFLKDLSDLITPEIVDHFNATGNQQTLAMLVYTMHVAHDQITAKTVTPRGFLNG